MAARTRIPGKRSSTVLNSPCRSLWINCRYAPAAESNTNFMHYQKHFTDAWLSPRPAIWYFSTGYKEALWCGTAYDRSRRIPAKEGSGCDKRHIRNQSWENSKRRSVLAQIQVHYHVKSLMTRFRFGKFSTQNSASWLYECYRNTQSTRRFSEDKHWIEESW